jgi:hypothetical protein
MNGDWHRHGGRAGGDGDDHDGSGDHHDGG